MFCKSYITPVHDHATCFASQTGCPPRACGSGSSVLARAAALGGMAGATQSEHDRHYTYVTRAQATAAASRSGIVIMAGHSRRLNTGSCTLLCRPIILLESNTGYPQIHQLLEKAGDRSKACAKLPCSTVAAATVLPCLPPRRSQTLRHCTLAFRNTPIVGLPAPQTPGTVHAVSRLCTHWGQQVRLTRMQVDAEEAQRVLKDLIFQRWTAEGCEERSETIKMVRGTGNGRSLKRRQRCVAAGPV